MSNAPLASPAPWLQCNVLTQHCDGSHCVETNFKLPVKTEAI